MPDFKLTSPVFEHKGFIPDKFTFFYENISPPLKWEGAPEGTQSFALIMFDPDAKTPGFVHWVFYNIPPQIRKFDIEIEKVAKVESLGIQGLNGKGEACYRGCGPGPGPAHPYHFHMYATDLPPTLPEGLNAAQLREALKDNILAETELIGMYQKS